LKELSAIQGNLPDLRRTDLPACRFSERCSHRSNACDAPLPTSTDGLHIVRCHHPLSYYLQKQEVAA
jgi:peptide/nickel transport system ATP-binding protein